MKIFHRGQSWVNYGVIGAANFGTVSDIHSSVNFTSDDTFMKNTVGGIVGKANQYCSGLCIERCSFSGTLDMGSADVDCLGGIVDYIYAGESVTVTDRAFYGEVKSTYTGMDQMGGILGYYRGCLLILQNSLSIGTFGITDYTLCGAIVGVLRQHSDANVMVTDNYYMSGNAFGNSTEGDDITDGYGNQTITGSATIVNELELENGTVASNLGEDWEQGEFYPILKK